MVDRVQYGTEDGRCRWWVAGIEVADEEFDKRFPPDRAMALGFPAARPGRVVA